MRLKPGDKFDRYTIEALLGEGGMGVVYRALDPKLMRRVALKVLRGAKTDADTWGRAVARMLREARAAAALNHPNAVGIFDVGEVDEAPYLAMELIEGTPLRRLIPTQHNAIPVSTRLRWLCDVARALSAAHRAGLVHRDIKPENVVLREDGVIKVLDFGIARGVRLGLAVSPDAETLDASAAAQASTITGQGTLVGTPAYMAPEQIRGDPLDGRADQFSWGVLAYELLSGRLPFGVGRDAVGMLAAVLTDKEPPLPGVAEVSESAAAIVHRALSKSPDDRFASMDEVVEALIALRAWTPEADVGPSSAPRSGPRSAPLQAHAEPRPASESGRLKMISTRTSAGGGVSGGTQEVLKPSRRPALRAALMVGAVLSLGALIAFSGRGAPEPSPAASSSSAPAHAPPAPTPITEVPPPKSQSPEALAAYRDGLQAFRDAAWVVAHRSFQRAVALDPALGAAHLRLALTTRYLGTPRETREAFHRAIQLRASLSERDQVILDCLEPRLYREPSDALEASRRLDAARARFPADAEIVALGFLVDAHNTPQKDLELSEQCLAVDPKYADCWQTKSTALARMDRPREAQEALDRCLAVSPSAHDCLRARLYMWIREGQCERFEEDARAYATQMPDIPEGHRMLARALFARGRSIETVRTALKQAWLREPAPTRERAARYDEVLLAIAWGRFDEAEQILREVLRDAELAPDEQAHTIPALILIEIYRETGRLKEAGKIAEAARAGVGAWAKPMGASAFEDTSIELLYALRQAGMVSEESYKAERAAWLRDLPKKYPTHAPGAEWVKIFGALAHTPEEAREALEMLPRRISGPPLAAPLPHHARFGRVYWLAGRGDEALPHLRRASADCDALAFPIDFTRALYQLGDVLASKGDKEGACAALRAVLDRWGKAKASVTAKAALARAKALGCGA